MNSNQKDSLDYSDPEVEKFSDGIVLEVMPQKNDSDSATKYILIKHDYYSSDSDHGRTLLKSIFNSLIKSSFKNLTVYLIDKGVLLLDKSNPLNESFTSLVNNCEIVIADDDSIKEYAVSFSSCDNKLSIQPFETIAEDIVYLSEFLVLE